MKIMFDVDGVLATGWVEIVASLGGISSVPELRSYDGWPGFSGKQWDAAVLKTHGIKDLWLQMNPMVTPEQFVRISYLNIDHDVYFVTNRYGFNPKGMTEKWLFDHGVYNPTVIICKNKAEFAAAVGINYSIEDKPGNAVCISYMARGCKSYLLDNVNNRFDPNVMGARVIRVNSVDEYLSDIESPKCHQ